MITYLNWDGPSGKETVDEFAQEPRQTRREYKKYVGEMVREYHTAGMNVYQSSRPCKSWRDKS